MMNSKPVRDKSFKIRDIKVYRDLTRLLGKLGVAPDLLQNQSSPKGAVLHIQNLLGRKDIRIHHYYGLGLAESKALVERMFTYEEENH